MTGHQPVRYRPVALRLRAVGTRQDWRSVHGAIEALGVRLERAADEYLSCLFLTRALFDARPEPGRPLGWSGCEP